MKHASRPTPSHSPRFEGILHGNVMASVSTGFTGPEYYDMCAGPIWFDPFAADLVRRLPRLPPGNVLEIACGTGLVTRRLREHLDPSVRLMATDLSTAMLDYASRKLGEHGALEWREADGSRLPVEDGAFGAVVCGFGIRRERRGGGGALPGRPRAAVQDAVRDA